MTEFQVGAFLVTYAQVYTDAAIVLGRWRRSTVKRVCVSSTTCAVISLAPRPILVGPCNITEESL